MPNVRDDIAAAYNTAAAPTDPALLKASLPLNPDDLARNLRDSERTGIPAVAVPNYQEVIRTKEIVDAYNEHAAVAPLSHKWASQDAFNMALVRDGLDKSARIEAAFKAKKAEMANEARPLSERVYDAATGAWVAAGSIIPRTGAGLLGIEEAFSELFIDPTARAIQRGLGVSQYSVGEQFKPGRKVYSKQADELGGVATEKMISGGVPVSIASGVTSGFQMMGQVIPALVAPATALPLMTSTVAGEEYGKARDKGLAPLRAAVYGVGQGAFEYATEKFAMGTFLEAVKKGHPLAKAAVGMLVKEIPGEQMATLLQDLNETATLHPEKTLADYLQERPDAALQTLVATLVGGGGMVTVSAAVDQVNRAANSIVNKLAKDQQASQSQVARANEAAIAYGRLKDAVAAANEHPLRARHEGKFHEFVSEVAQDSDIAEVYFDSKALAEVLSQSGAEGQALLAKLPEVASQLQEGLSIGDGNVRVDTADLLTHVTNPTLQESLLSIAKREPSGMTYNESQVFFQSEAKNLEKAAAETDAAAQTVLTKEEYDAANAEMVTADEVKQLATERIKELSEQPEVTQADNEEAQTLADSLDKPEALAQFFGKQLVAQKPTYEQHLKTRADKTAVRVAEAANLRNEIAKDMREMGFFTETAVQTYATPLAEFYRVNAARMNMLPSELQKVVPLKFFTEKMSGANPQENNKATRESFTKANIGEILNKSDWAIMTAENPMARELSDEENAARNAALEEDLKAGGFDYIKVDGVYDRPNEKSFVVLGITEEQATALGNKHEQDSVLTRDGFIYSDGQITKSNGIAVHDTAPEQYFTTLPDGTMFTIGLKMDADFNLVKEERTAEDPIGVLSQYAQLTEDVASREIPEGPLSQQDLSDLRRMWEMYTLSEGGVAQYGTSAAKAEDISQVESAIANLSDIMGAVYAKHPGKPALADVTKMFEGERFPKGNGYAISFSSEDTVDGKRKFRTGELYIDMSDKTIQINLSQWGEGGRGSAVYKSVFDFARNNGFVFIGDAAGISTAGVKRRLEAMLSHALQTGEVNYMALHPKQIAFIEKETGIKIQWLSNDPQKSIEQMLNAAYNLAVKYTPEIKNVYFDFATRTFNDSRTGAAASSLIGLVTKTRGNTNAVAREGAAGSATLKRTALANTILRTRPENRHLVFRALSGFVVDMLPGAERLLYQQTGGVAKEGAISIIGHHFSPKRHSVLEGRMAGTGLPGAERTRLAESKDGRIRERLNFYVDEGQGVFPEWGVGREEHVVQLHNMYDAAKNPLRLKASDSNAFEAAVLDAGFDGYYVKGGFGRQGAAVLLGKAAGGVAAEGAHKQVEAAANNAVAERLPELKQQYLARATKDGVVTIDVDEARELFPDYAASKSSRSHFSAAVHEASSTIAKSVYADVLKQEPAEGKMPLVIFTAGGGGSGKSSARAAQGEMFSKAQVIYDGVMSDFDSSKARIEAALAAGKQVSIQFVSRDPMRAWVEGVLPRANETGRVVSLYAHAAAHRGAAQTIQRLAVHYKNNPNVDIQVIENHGGPKDIKLGRLDNLASVNYNDLEARLYEALDKEFQNGSISRQVYQAAKIRPSNIQGVLPEIGERGYFQSQEINRPQFYSALTRAVEGLKQTKGDAAQWSGIIKNLKGVKKAEIDYTGVLDWLEAREDVVTREEIVEYLRGNNVVVNPLAKTGVHEEEIELDIGSWETEEPDMDWLRERAQEVFDQDPEGERERYAERNGINPAGVEDSDVLDYLTDAEVVRYYDSGDAPESRSITLALGAEEYTATETSDVGERQLYMLGEVRELPRRADEADIRGEMLSILNEKGLYNEAEGEPTKWGDYVAGGLASGYAERLLLNSSHKGTPFEYDTHWDEQNVIAFTRISTREVELAYIQEEHPELAARLKAQGKTHAKVYFLEEVQSDWAQQGRDKEVRYESRGYTRDMLSPAPEMARREELRAGFTFPRVDVAMPGAPENLFYEAVRADGQVVSRGNRTLEEAQFAADIHAMTNRWVIDSTDGQVFEILKKDFPTLEQAMQHIVDTKTRSVPVEELTMFEVDARTNALEKQLDEAHSATIKARRVYDEMAEPESEAYYNDVLEPLREKEAKLREELRSLPSGGIAKAPFVTTTDAWVSLALKDAMRAAAEGDYDLISWTTGPQQTERWSGGLRQRVDRIGWEKSADGRIHIQAEKGRVIQGDTHYSENELTSAIGKTMAERIINDPNQSGVIEGRDIVVADLGMSYFYGDAEGTNPEGTPAIVTKVANQLAKQLGAPPVRGLTMNPTRYSDRSFSSQPILEVTPELKEMALQGLPLFQKKLAYFDPEQMMIAMLKGAKLSSMIHESGHFYLEALSTMSAHPNATQQMKDDFDKTMKWFGVPDRATWNAMTLDQKRPFHEQWAQSNERWILEGKAPTVDMQPVFARFRAWMLSVYKSLERFLQKNPLAGKLNDEMRGVFARLIAAEDAIREAEAAREFTALTKPESTSEDAYNDYLSLGQEATQTAVSDMQARTLRDMKWSSSAKHKALRKVQREAATKRKAIREEVTAEVMKEPVNQARTFLKTGALKAENGDAIEVTVGHRIDTGALREMYPETMLSRPDLTKLRGMTSATEGVHPDLLAPIFGFRSGDALVRELIEAEKPEDKIAGLTDQRMLEENGELVDADAVERAAEAAIHNEVRARFLATGLTMLTNGKAHAREIVKAAKMAAETIIARKKVRELRPKQYSAAEARANRKALELAPKEPALAADAQRAALLNNQLASAAADAVADVDSAVRFANKFKSEGVRKNLDIEYLEQIDDLLNGFDFRKGQTLKAIDKRRSFAEFVALQEERGFEPIVSADQMEVMSRKHYKDMTVEELRGLVDAVKHIEHLARLKKKLLTAKDERDFAQRIAEAVASIEVNANRTVEERATPSDVVGRLGQLARGFAAEHRKVASLVREMDGSKDGGTMWDLLIRPMNEAGDNETAMRAQAAEKMAELFTPIRKKMGGVRGHLKVKRTIVPGTKLSMSYEERIMFAMNWGNEGNRQRLMDGGLTGKRSLTEAEAQAILATLDKQDWDFVQGTWDYIGSFRPAVAEMERDLTGKEPKWVDAAVVETKFGTYRGGYFPAKYDAELSTRSESLEAAATLRMGMKGAFGNAGTRNGYTQKRAEQVVDRPILLSFNVISQHVGEVTHRLAWQRWVVDANRVLRALDGAVRDSYGPEVLREMKKLVEDVAAGDAGASNSIERAINRLRTGSTIVGMGWRVTTAMLQPSGLAQSWVRVGGKWTALGVKKYLSNPMAATEFAEQRSKLLRDRNRTMAREINEILNTVRVGEKVSNVQASFFWMIAKMQRTVDIPTWHGAYEKAVAQLGLENAASEQERTAIEERAAAMADQAVLDAQSGGQLKDLARVQRGSPINKLFTNFYSYFSATYNLNVEAYRRTKFSDPAQVGAFAADMLILNTLPVLFAVALKELLKGGCDNDDVACLLKQVGQEQTNYLFGQMVLLREVGAAVGAATGDSFGYSGPAGLRFFADLYKAGEQVRQGEADFAAWKATTNALAAPLHLPMGQVNTTIEGIIAIENGDVEGISVISALVAGKPRPE